MMVRCYGGPAGGVIKGTPLPILALGPLLSLPALPPCLHSGSPQAAPRGWPGLEARMAGVGF